MSRPEEVLQAQQFVRPAAGPEADQGAGQRPLAAPGKDQPVGCAGIGRGRHLWCKAAGAGHGDSGQVELRPAPIAANRARSIVGAPFPPQKMSGGKGFAQAGIADGAPGQHHQVVPLRGRPRRPGPGQAQGDLGPEDGGHAAGPGRLGETDSPVHAVMVGDGQRRQLQPGRLFHQFVGVRGPVQEAEIAMAVQLGVRALLPSLRVYERVFALARGAGRHAGGRLRWAWSVARSGRLPALRDVVSLPGGRYLGEPGGTAGLGRLNRCALDREALNLGGNRGAVVARGGKSPFQPLQ